MRRAIAVATGLVSLAWLSIVAVPGASAFPLTTCTLTVESKDASGNVISTATHNGPGGTRDNPLIVDPNGTVTWTGSTGGSVKDGTYHVEIFGVPTPLQGPINSSGSTASGSVNLGDILPFDLVGLIYVSGGVNVGGSPYCEGSGWISLRGDPVGTPGFVGGAGLALVGVATLLTSVKGRHPFRGAIGGLLGGAGLALLSGVTGVLPLDETTPLVEVISAVILGLVIGIIDFGSLFRRTPVTLAAQAGADAATPPAEPETGEPTGKPTEPATTPTPPVVPPAVVVPPVVPPPVVPPAVVPPVVPPPVVAPSQGPASTTTSTSAGPEPKPGLEAIRAGVDRPAKGGQAGRRAPVPAGRDDPPLRSGHAHDRLRPYRPADGTGRDGSQGHPPRRRRDRGGAKGFLTATVKPVVTNGTVSLDLGSGGKMADGLGKLDGLKKFLENANRAVMDAGQRVTSVTVSPTGIAVTTGPGTPSAPGSRPPAGRRACRLDSSPSG